VTLKTAKAPAAGSQHPGRHHDVGRQSEDQLGGGHDHDRDDEQTLDAHPAGQPAGRHAGGDASERAERQQEAVVAGALAEDSSDLEDQDGEPGGVGDTDHAYDRQEGSHLSVPGEPGEALAQLAERGADSRLLIGRSGRRVDDTQQRQQQQDGKPCASGVDREERSGRHVEQPPCARRPDQLASDELTSYEAAVDTVKVVTINQTHCRRLCRRGTNRRSNTGGQPGGAEDR
jgi:hypothetical protein